MPEDTNIGSHSSYLDRAVEYLLDSLLEGWNIGLRGAEMNSTVKVAIHTYKPWMLDLLVTKKLGSQIF